MNSTITLLLSLTLLLPALAQSPVPIEKEPRHHLKFENQYVRVFYVFIPPGDTTLFHTHVNDGVGIRLTDAQLRDEVLGGKPNEGSVNRGAVGFTHYPSPLTHRVSNIGSSPFRNIFVEVLPSTGMPSNAPSLADVAGQILVLENDRVRIFRLVLAPGQSTEVHSHALRGVGVAITDGKITVEVPGKKTKTVKFKPGDYQWHEGGMKHSLRNVGSAPFEAVDIELK
jgi:quercetin dioxygenase-like cupin family protein